MEVKALYSGKLSVHPVGRVGSIQAARAAKRCRARKYWAIQEFEQRPYPGPNFYHERTDLGKFKTKKLANQFLWKLFQDGIADLTYGDLNSYISIKLKPKI